MSSLRINELDQERGESSVITLVNDIFRQALHQGASDIHIEPNQISCRVRFRQDGMLFQMMSFPIQLAVRIITRLKIMANLDISEKRLPQDGRLLLAEFPHLNTRINTCPSLWGEKIVLRLQNAGATSLTLPQLGMTQKQQEQLQHILSEPHGLFIVAGPTGSGKTQTLYAALRYLNSVNKNILTIEDPVEIALPEITQINVQPKIGLNFPAVLRSILRQDPDIIMIGEIRDYETAVIAMQAASTGHLVLSTLHANNAYDALLRFQALGIDIQDFKNMGPCILSQRLIRCLCAHCKKPKTLEKNSFEAKGCDACSEGYRERTGIFELKNFKQSPFQTYDVSTQESHLQALWNAGWQKVKEGITSLEELSRVLGHIYGV